MEVTQEKEETADVVEAMEIEEEKAPASVNPMINIFSMENKAKFMKSPQVEKQIEEEIAKAGRKETVEEKPAVDKHKDDALTIFVGNLPGM